MSDSKLETHLYCGLVAFLLGALLTGRLTSCQYREAAIEHGAAHYDTKTGKWQWNNP